MQQNVLGAIPRNISASKIRAIGSTVHDVQYVTSDRGCGQQMWEWPTILRRAYALHTQTWICFLLALQQLASYHELCQQTSVPYNLDVADYSNALGRLFFDLYSV